MSFALVVADPGFDAGSTRDGFAGPRLQDPYLSRNRGFAYAKGPLEITSSTNIAESKAPAEEVIAVLRTKKGTTCMKTLLTEELTKQVTGSGARISTLVLEPVIVTVAGADSVFALHMAITVAGPAGSITLTGYDLGVLVGQTEITLNSIETASSTYTLAELATLAEKVTARVKAVPRGQ